MAVGDILNGIGALVNTYYYFIPALGVEAIITSILGDGTTCRGGLSNGVINSGTKLSDDNEYGAGNCKVGITNTNYLVYYCNAGSPPSFSGIQTR